MNGVASTQRGNSGRRADPKQYLYEGELLEEEAWTRKPSTQRPYADGGGMRVFDLTLFDDDRFTQHGRGKRQGSTSPIRPDASDDLEFPEIGFAPVSARSLWGVTFDVLRILRAMGDIDAGSLTEIESRLQRTDNSAWLTNPGLILERLESGELSETEQRSAIAHAESLAFSDSQRERLLALYEARIEASRFTEADEEITTICAAIRKYAMNMGSDRWSRCASWLAPSASERVHQDIELELTKGAYWHLRYLPTEPDANLRGLQAVLADEAGDYLKPRLILDKNYASIAKFAILACLLIDARQGESDVSHRVWSQKTQLSMNWFDRLVKFELGKAVDSIAKRDQDFADAVNELVAAIEEEGE